MEKSGRLRKRAVRVAVKLPGDLCTAVDIAAGRKAITKSELIRNAIENECRHVMKYDAAVPKSREISVCK